MSENELKPCRCGRSFHIVNFCKDLTYNIACKCGVFVQHISRDEVIKVWDYYTRPAQREVKWPEKRHPCGSYDRVIRSEGFNEAIDEFKKLNEESRKESV